MELLIFCILIWACFGGLSVWIASQKGRSAGEGFVLGFAFGPVGVIVESLLPNGDDALGPRKAGVSSRSSRSSYEPATLTTPAIEEDVDMDVMDALGLQPAKKPDTNEEFLRSLRIPD